MEKEKGFTLIELLAVIVILAILTVIAVPKILNVIEKSRESAALSSAKLYIDAVQKNNAISEVNGTNTQIEDGTYDDIKKLNVNVKGDKPTSGTLTILNGKVTTAQLCINKYLIVYENSKAVVKNNNCSIDGGSSGGNTGTNNKVYSNGDIVYFNPQTGEKCNSYNESNSNSGVKTGCMKWYAFLDKGKESSELNLLLDHNTSENVAWNSMMGNIEPKYMLEVKNRLAEDTSGWTGNPRLITADEIARIVGNNDFNSETAYKDQGISFSNKEFGWIFDRTSTVCQNYGCPHNSDNSYFGYWTSSRAIGYSNSDYYAWGVTSEGKIAAYPTNVTSPGVRPVITIKK